MRKQQIQIYSFCLQIIWWLDTLKNTTWENAVDQRKKETDQNLTSG